MPAGWISAGVGAIGLIDSMTGGGSSGGGGGGGSNRPGLAYGQYMPQAEQGWYNDYVAQTQGADQTYGNAVNGINQSYNMNQMLNPYFNPNVQPQQSAGGNGYQPAYAPTASGGVHQIVGQTQQAPAAAYDYPKTQGNFDAAAYMAANPDVTDPSNWVSGDAWKHYEMYGQKEGRPFTAISTTAPGLPGGGTGAQSGAGTGNGGNSTQMPADGQPTNPFWKGYTDSANAAGQQYKDLSGALTGYQNQSQAGANLALGQQQKLYGAGDQLWQMGLDPQKALYDRTAGQLTNQVNAGQAARGLGNSAVGADEYNSAMSNFNIDWQNQQLQRAIAGSQGQNAANAVGMQQGQLQGQNLTAAAAYGTAAPAAMQQAGQIPLQAQQTMAAFPGQQAQTYMGQMQQALAPYNANQASALQYLTGGSGSQQGAAQIGQQQQQFDANQQQGSLNALTQGLGSIAGIWKNTQTPQTQYPSAPTGGYTDYTSNGYTGGYNSNIDWSV